MARSTPPDALEPFLAEAWRSSRRLLARAEPLELHVVLTSYDTSFEPIAAQVATKLEELRSVFPAHGPVNVHVRIVDDASAKSTFGREVDRAFAAARRGPAAGMELVREPLFYGSPGPWGRKGLALREGFLSALDAGADVVVYANLNLKVHAAQIATGLALLVDGALDAAIGSRADDDGGRAVGRNRLGELKSDLYSQAVHAVFPELAGYRDQNAPLKLFSRRAARVICERARIDDLAHDVEWLLFLEEAGLAIGRFPILWQQRRGSRPPFGAIGSMLNDLRGLRRATRHQGRARGDVPTLT